LYGEEGGVTKMKALVIDDDQRVLDRITGILADEGYEVDSSLSGLQGLKWAIQRHYDIVITDIRMPDISGMIVLRDIKMARPLLPVIIISGRATMHSAEHAMKLGATDYLEKPFSRSQLLNMVASAIEIALSQDSREQEVIHKEAILKVLERAAFDNEFTFRLLNEGVDALEGYELSSPEKIAILTGDISWIEDKVGSLTPSQRRWLDLSKQSGIW
jgi:DNA-binding NtrC family response regulator